MMSTENPVQFHPPVHEDTITPAEIHELFSRFVSDEPTIHPTSSSETNRPVYSMEERKRRRMVSNRESARRSRLRKKQHIQDVANEVNRFKLENRELKNRVCTITQDCHTIQRDSNRLLSESIYLQHRLTGLREILDQPWRYNSNEFGYFQNRSGCCSQSQLFN